VLRKLLPKESDRRVQVNGRGMLKFTNLLSNSLHPLRMAMADRNGDDTGEAVEILFAGFIPQVLQMPFNDEQRLLVIGDQARREVLPAQGKHFVTRRARVGSRPM